MEFSSVSISSMRVLGVRETQLCGKDGMEINQGEGYSLMPYGFYDRISPGKL